MTSRAEGNHRKAAVRARAAILDQAITPFLAERLENRLLFAAGGVATLADGVLDVRGTRHADTITVNLEDATSGILDVSINGNVTKFTAADVKQINVFGGAGNDTIVVQSNDVSLTTPALLNGGTGNNWLVGGDGPDTMIGGAGKDKIIGGSVHNVIDGNGGGDLINTDGSPSVVAKHRHEQLVDGAGAALSNTDKHGRRYVKANPIKSTVIPIVGAAGGGYNLTQLRHLYGLDQLDGINAEFPVYTNSGAGQSIAIVAPRPFPDLSALGGLPGLLGIGGDLDQFDALMGLPRAGVRQVIAPNQTGGLDPQGAIETALDVEWAHAMAPSAQIILVEVDSVNGSFFGSDLVQGVAEAANQLNRVGGGVVSMSFGSSSEDPILANQFNAVFGSKYNRGISWIASAGDNAGDLSLPAMSQYVTSVGGTTSILDAAGNPLDQSAWLYGGGGQSRGVIPLPAYQAGITVAGRAVKGYRVGPDLSIIAESNGGAVEIVVGSTVVSVSGTSVGAPIFAGMVADANELRFSLRESVLGAGLNTELYKAYRQNSYGASGNFTDIDSGNNTHQAVPGFDLATGMGVPQANNLIPALGGQVITNTPLTLFGDVISALNAGGLAGPGVQAIRGGGSASIGPSHVTLNFVPITVPITLGNAVSSSLTGSVSFPVALNGTFNGIAVVDITTTTTTTDPTTGGTVTTTTTNTFTCRFSGRITRVKGRTHLSGTVVTVDPVTLKTLTRGLQPIFTATFSA